MGTVSTKDDNRENRLSVKSKTFDTLDKYNLMFIWLFSF